jgi:hypothetical protein
MPYAIFIMDNKLVVLSLNQLLEYLSGNRKGWFQLKYYIFKIFVLNVVFQLNSKPTHFLKYVCMSVFCFDMENSLLKFFHALWTHFVLLLKYYAFIEVGCLEGITGLNSYKSNNYSFSKKFPSSPDYTCGSSMKAFHIISTDTQQNTAISAVIIVIGFIIKGRRFRLPVHRTSLCRLFLLQISEVVN